MKIIKIGDIILVDDTGKLTEQGTEIARKLYNKQCDRVLCAFCGSRSATGGPGGERCVVEGTGLGGEDVQTLLTLHMGRKPGFEALDALVVKKHL